MTTPVSLKSAARADANGMHMDEDDILPEAVAAPLVVEFTEEEIIGKDSD